MEEEEIPTIFLAQGAEAAKISKAANRAIRRGWSTEKFFYVIREQLKRLEKRRGEPHRLPKPTDR